MLRPFLAVCLWLATAIGIAQAAPGGLLPLATAELAPGFTLATLEGREHRLEDYAGQPLVVKFWASWCPMCRSELPSLDYTAAVLAERGVRVISINMGEPAATVARFLEQVPVAVPVLLDPDSAVAGAWRVSAVPTAVVVDAAGRIAYRVIGVIDWTSAAVLEQLQALGQAAGG